MTSYDVYEELLRKHLGSSYTVKSIKHVVGGCINTTLRIDTQTDSFFIKENSVSESDLLEKERLGLAYLKAHSPLMVPGVLGSGQTSSKVYLILEWVEKNPTGHEFWETFGQGLAEQHSVRTQDFGFEHNNHIGRLPQSNKWKSKWSDFFINERLLPQLKLATGSHMIDATTLKQFELLFDKLDSLVPNDSPSLLHGDLWSGNFISGKGSQAYLIDPSVHYGHRETELAFTTMFGGFDQAFYEAYKETYPLEQGFKDRIEIHNLYPLLVHVNLFGPSYLSGVISTLKRYS